MKVNCLRAPHMLESRMSSIKGVRGWGYSQDQKNSKPRSQLCFCCFCSAVFPISMLSRPISPFYKNAFTFKCFTEDSQLSMNLDAFPVHNDSTPLYTWTPAKYSWNSITDLLKCIDLLKILLLKIRIKINVNRHSKA